MAREGAAARRTALVSMRAQMHLPIPPVWMDSPRTSILEQLDTLVMRYIPQLEGVLLTHADARFLGTLGGILGDSAFSEAPVAFTALVWRPQIGMRLEGAITLSSPSHVSLLLHGTFNAAISAQHLPAAKYEFVHYDDDDAHAARTDAHDRSVGFWRHKKTGERLGGAEQRLAFTVISMTVANHMLSLHGSLLKDPFSVAPPRPGSLSFDQALAEREPLDEPEAEPEAPPPRARKLRFDSDAESDTDARAAPREPVEVEDDGHDSASSDEYGDARTSDASASDDASSDADDAPTTAVPRKPVRHDEAEAVAAQRQAETRREARAQAAEEATEAELDALQTAAQGKKEKKKKEKKEKEEKKEKKKEKEEKEEKKEKKEKKEKEKKKEHKKHKEEKHEARGDARPKEKRKSDGEGAASSKRRKAST